MSLDTKLIQEINGRRFDPWIKGSTKWVGSSLPSVPGLDRIEIIDRSVWIGADIGHSPDPTSVVVIRHIRLGSFYKAPERSFITSLYRVVDCHEWSGVQYPEQRDLMQKIIDDEERIFGNRVSLIIDGTGVGAAIGQDWKNGLRGYAQFLAVTFVSGQPRSIESMAVSDALQNTMSAFEQGRVALPSGSKNFLVRKLMAQLTTRGIEEDFRGRLRAIDERKSGLNHYDLSVALSLVVGHIEQVDSTYTPIVWFS